MQIDLSRYEVRIASSEEERSAARRLRYQVFVTEMGAHASEEEIAAEEEWDRFDPYFDNLILLDRSGDRPGPNVVGVYRLMTDAAAREGIGFYGEGEYDLEPLRRTGRKSVELGRSCVAREHRGGAGMHLLWHGLAKYVMDRGVEILFGVASFHGTDPEPLSDALTFLMREHLAPPDLRVRARDENYLEMERFGGGEYDRNAAILKVPALIKAYLRLGGFVGDGAFVDHDFNTIDVCVIMDTARMKDRYLNAYKRSAGRGV